MYKTSEEYKNLILADSTQQALNIYIDGTRIEDRYVKGLKFSHKLFEDDEFCFGSTPAKTATLEINIDGLPDTYNRIYIESGIDTESFTELIPMGYFNVDEISKKDAFTVELKLIDDMTKLEFGYDGSENIDYPAPIKDVLQDICDTAGIELGTTEFLNDDVEVDTWDNSITARQWVGYIAEQAGGFAVIGRDGKLYINTIGEDTGDLDFVKHQSFTWGEEFIVSRIAYEDGVQDYKYGDETYNTIWINQDNLYIISSEQIENIYNKYAGFECYSYSGDIIVDPAWDIGDVIVTDDKRLLYQGDIEYKGKFKAGIKSEIQCKAKEDSMTTVTSTESKIRKVKSTLDQIAGTIDQIIVEQVEIQAQTNDNTTDIWNTYQELLQLLGEYATLDDIITVTQSVETAMDSAQYAIEIAQSAQVGATEVTTETGYTFNKDGLTISKTGSEVQSKLDEAGLTITDNTGSTGEELFYAGYDTDLGETIVRTKNLNVDKYLIIGKYTRFEDYEIAGQIGTGAFWIGDSNTYTSSLYLYTDLVEQSSEEIITGTTLEYNIIEKSAIEFYPLVYEIDVEGVVEVTKFESYDDGTNFGYTMELKAIGKGECNIKIMLENESISSTSSTITITVLA